METIPLEISSEIGTYLTLTDLTRWAQTNSYYRVMSRFLILKRLGKLSIRVITFIVHYLASGTPATEVLAKILIGPTESAERSSILNESTIIRKLGPSKFNVIDDRNRFLRIEITDTLLGREVGSDDLFDVLSGNKPLVLSQPMAFSPMVPFGSGSPIIVKKTKPLPTYRVSPIIRCKDIVTVERAERNSVVYHLAFDAQSEFFSE